MGLYTKLPADLEEVDVIIVGGGCAGCIIAGRLADADPNLSILIVESGANNKGLPVVDHVSVWLNHVLPGNPHAKIFHGPKSDLLAGRQATVPVGHILGGGTSINSLFYSRPQRSDYESWNTPGWSPEDLLPYMKKFETYKGPGPKDMHGYNGPIQVSEGPFRSRRLEDDFIAAMETVGWPEVDDINCFGLNNGSMRLLKYMSPKGQRQDTATIYLHPRLEDGQHPNLHVLVESQVERVLFEGTRAVGVSFRPNPDYHPDPGSDSIREIKARRLVIITGGSMFSPLILQRSGIGDPKVLKKAGVPIVADVPGVGADYEDHNSMMYPYSSSLRPDETLDSLYSGRTSLDDMIAAKHEMLSYGGVDVQSKLRPTEADVEALGPKFKAAWDKSFKDIPDKPLTIISPVACFPGDSSFLGPGQFLTLVTFTLYPFSRGHLYITGPRIDDPLDFDPGLLSDPNDLDVKPHIWMFKKQREIAHHMNLCRDPVPSTQPTFPADSKANLDNPNTEYSAEDDEIIEKWIRERINSTWHPIGTCKMAPRDKHGVVDPALNVYGVQGLKVADLSISPHNVGANTSNTAMTVAEKAANIIISELGLIKK
ncbi:alcohol oxidase-like protein [Xylaria flabelliformis]|nr:alcohol oxidase-like protein [Xylaria flabelliformis]